MKFLTYQEPQSSAYQQFVSNLKMDARNWFNYSMDDSLVLIGWMMDGWMMMDDGWIHWMLMDEASDPHSDSGSVGSDQNQQRLSAWWSWLPWRQFIGVINQHGLLLL